MILGALLIPNSALLQAQAAPFSLLPCGTSGTRDCQFTDLIVLIVRIINFLLAGSALLAMFYIVVNAYRLVSALGNPQIIADAKAGLTNAILGFAIVLISFAVVNFLVQGLFGRAGCEWWRTPGALWPANGASSCLLPRNSP